MSEIDPDVLLNQLARYISDGTFDPQYGLPVLQRLTASIPPLNGEKLIEALLQHRDPAVAAMVPRVQAARHSVAAQLHAARRDRRLSSGESIAEQFPLIADLPTDAPLGWVTLAHPLKHLVNVLGLARDTRFASTRRAEALETASRLNDKLNETLSESDFNLFPRDRRFVLKVIDAARQQYADSEELVSALDRLESQIHQRKETDQPAISQAVNDWTVPIPAELDEEDVLDELVRRHVASSDRSESHQWLDRLCTWPGLSVAGRLNAILQSPDDRERASLIFTLRVGSRNVSGWSGWRNWLAQSERVLERQLDELDRIVQKCPVEVLALWCRQQSFIDGEVESTMESWCRTNASGVNPERFVERWSDLIPERELNALLGVFHDPDDVFLPDEEPAAEATAAERTQPLSGTVQSQPVHRGAEQQPAASPEPSAFLKPPGPPLPSVWRDHVQPFFAENWYMVAGVLMVIAGSSLLAWFTWDKHWAVRYTIMPALLAMFTWALGAMGSWVERQDRQFQGTAAILRGAAVGLLPINFMAVALLSNDDQVEQKVLVVPLLGIVYLVMGAWGLKAWCRRVDESLRWTLGGTLLLLNSLVMIGPLAQTFAGVDGEQLNVIMGTGFHVGFLVMAGAVIRFSERVLTPEMAAERRVPWFFGATLVITFGQVFGWVHGYLKHLPEVWTYAPMVILSGWLVLLMERRARILLARPSHLGGESFLGFALVLLGALMGTTQPAIRVLSFALAGTVWTYQAVNRQSKIHDWFGLTLLMMSVASVGILDGFPRPGLPVLGLLAAAILGGLHHLFRFRNCESISQSAIGLQVTVLMLTTIVAGLCQWRFQTPPLYTGVCLLIIVAWFFWRAFRDDQLRWVHSGMAVLALSLLYLGCVDMEGRRLEGNTMVFGLSVLSLLWLGLLVSTRSSLLLRARSTVLWVYGTLAVAAMVLRVVVERDTTVSGDWLHHWMDYSGPLLMAAVLVTATWFSRSLIPAMMAMTIVVILFPELKVTFRGAFEQFGWGTGLGSACSALGLLIASFPLRRAAFLSNLSEGDRFFDRTLFPLRRYDHKLFTWPLVASAVFLISRVDTWVLVSNLIEDRVGLKTSIAVGVTSLCWMLTAVYAREYRQSVLGTYLGGLLLLISFLCGHWHLSDDPHWYWPVLMAGAVLQLHWLLCLQWRARFDWIDRILMNPMRTMLSGGSLVVSAICITSMLSGQNVEALLPLLVFTAGQLIWHGLRTRRYSFGSMLFFTVWITLLAGVPGDQPLLLRLTLTQAFEPTIGLLLGILVVHVLFELKRDRYLSLKPLLLPFNVAGSLLIILVALLALYDSFVRFELSSLQVSGVFLAVVLAARAHRSVPLGLLALLLSYVLVSSSELQSELMSAVTDRWELLALPWRVSLLSLVMALAGHIGRLLRTRARVVVHGSFPLKFLKADDVVFVFVPAIVLAVFGTAYHTVSSEMREEPVQLLTPFVAAATLAVIGWSWQRSVFYAIGTPLLTLGNIHMIRVFAGDELRGIGLSEIHLVCLGLAASLLEANMIRRLVPRNAITAYVNRASLVLAMLILSLLSANYFVHPDLSQIPAERFAVSGAMAILAGWYFRRAARHPDQEEQEYVDWCEGFYHFALTLAIWCAALMVPVFRLPATAILAFGLPVLWFYFRSETDFQNGLESGRRYQNSATVLSFTILAFYVCRGLFQMILFPNEPVIQTAYYHLNAPLVMVIALILLRLHGLGGNGWLAFYGGLALMVGSYFTLTLLPASSPFDHPLQSTWYGIGLAHFWILFSTRRSPVRTAIQRLAAIDESQWFALRRSWGVCLQVAIQGLVLWGLTDWRSNSLLVAPLLVASASVLLHHGLIRRLPVYFVIAGLQLLLALHMDFFVVSWLPQNYVIWTVLLVQLLLLVVHQISLRFTPVPKVGTVMLALSGLVFLHVLWHHPESVTGLIAVTVGSLLAALTPRPTAMARNNEERVFAGLMLLVPVWLAFFSQTQIREAGLNEAFRSWPLLASTAVLLAVGTFARVFQVRLFSVYDELDRPEPRLFDQTCHWLGTSGTLISSIVLWFTLGVTIAIQLLHYSDPFDAPSLMLTAGLFAALTAGFYFEGRLRRNMASYLAVQLSVLAFFGVIRRHLLLTTDLWTYEYDVWASLVVSFGLAGSKQLIDLEPKQVRIPLLGTLFALPVVALIWVLYHHLGTNVALLVVGLHSLMFSFMGKDDRQSPYHLIGIAGFVSFVLIVFWAKLELRVLHAYTVPVGIGVLIMLQLFREQIHADTRNRIRLVTILMMLGSAGYYALVDDRYPVAFNLSLILLCLAAMGLGSFFRIRLYLTLGFSMLLLDLISIVGKVLTGMERGVQMTAVGSIVLLIGISLVFGAIYYKTHQAAVTATADRWRAKFGDWE